MTCYGPLTAYRSAVKNPSGKRGIVFDKAKSIDGIELEIACGQCIGCRLSRSAQWAVRCMHEASQHEQNCFITLTYNDEHLPQHGSLVREHFQKFVKRLRARNPGQKIRVYYCGEYGEQQRRPHYHALLFGFDFADKQLISQRLIKKAPKAAVKAGWIHSDTYIRLWSSDLLTEVWGMGLCSVGEVTFDSAAYVARYIMKKMTGDAADDHYLHIDPMTGECWPLTPEFNGMSLKPAIGLDWFEKYRADVFPHDFVLVDGKKLGVPKYYTKRLEAFDAIAHEKIKATRKKKAKEHWRDCTPERLATREECTKAKLKLKARTL
jgi:hypothetical protein